MSMKEPRSDSRHRLLASPKLAIDFKLRIMAIWFLGLVVVLSFVEAAQGSSSGSRRHNNLSEGNGLTHRSYNFFIKESNITRLCREKTILTVNGQFPGPAIYARRGDVVVVNVYNQGHTNITLHWHGVNQPRSPWWDGPEYITQCPIQPGNNFTYRIIFSEEEGTLWWHAHTAMDRATVHGAIIIRPSHGAAYPFTKPHREIPIILGEWWNDDVGKVMADALATGSDFQPSDANTINGQPGDLLPCSSDSTFRLPVKHGETYMLRIINAALTNGFFFAIAGHRLTVVSSDGSYTKPFTTDYIFIESGQTMTVLLKARRRGHSNARYYVAVRPLATNPAAVLDNSTATAILEYINASSANRADFPTLPSINDSSAAAAYTAQLRSLASKEHPADVPRRVDEHMLVTVAVNEISCAPNEAPCKGPHGNRFASSLNNISFEAPHRDILGAYYRSVVGDVAKTDFPDNPPLSFNFTADNLPPEIALTARGTRVKFLAYGTVVEVVFQGTTILGGDSHPMHLHGFSFYVVGRGIGNFDRHHDPAKYNLVDPPYQNTVSVAKNGWAAIRFRAANPGVWFMHCHFERHMVWGMETVFIVKNGKRRDAKVMPPPPNMPRC
ncbi:putative laccase-9 [Lolium perenne]|uniref:putative laccase-9 n=1 Tax=Lolium perenne TaxID=4522 RepID=UPI0021F55FDB|nr:putative laccase-9 [Lolium perenne]